MRGFPSTVTGSVPGRSAHQAVAKAQQYIAQGRGWAVDLELEKFFDRVNHDRLMKSLALTHRRQANAPADWSVLEGGCNGKRAGRSGR
jgi:hypothetical protein